MPALRPDATDFKKGRVPREVRRQQLLTLAEELLIEHGYEKFSIEDLCHAAGVSRPVVYEHLGSKDVVYLAVQRHVREEFHQNLTDATGSAKNLAEAVSAGSAAFFTILERNPRRWLMVFGSTTGFAGQMADELWELRYKTVSDIAAMLNAFDIALGSQRVEALAHSISGGGEGLGRWWMRNLDVPRNWVVAQHVSQTLATIEAAKTLNLS